MSNKIDKQLFFRYIEIKEMRNMVDNGKEVRKQMLDVLGGIAAGDD